MPSKRWNVVLALAVDFDRSCLFVLGPAYHFDVPDCGTIAIDWGGGDVSLLKSGG
jgi:hypothetical protein